MKNKSLKIRFSGRSSDFIAPSFAYGCLYNCSYCYMKRNKPKGLDVYTNTNQILNAISFHANEVKDLIEKPNQTHPIYVTYDISCNEDFALHHKYHNWEHIFNFFKQNNNILGTFATKYIPTTFLSFNPNKKIRIRFSLIPEKIRQIVEPNTTKILDRILAINTFIESGYDVHLNFSPIILYKNWETDYIELFNLLNKHIKEEYKKDVLAEVIFLTHQKQKHEYNIENNIPGENLLWFPTIQEQKYNSFGNKAIRYEKEFKRQQIEKFIEIHDKVIKWNTIRYIF
jgi:spore photoproduct lyase